MSPKDILPVEDVGHVGRGEDSSFSKLLLPNELEEEEEEEEEDE